MTDVSKMTPLERIAHLKAVAAAKASGAAAVTPSVTPSVTNPARPSIAQAVAATQPAQAQAQAQPTSLSTLLARAKVASQASASVVQAPPPKPDYALPTGTELMEADQALLCEGIRSLCTALHEQEEGISGWLHKVHEQLRVAPELAHMLTDEQVSVLYKSIIKQSNVAIVPAAKAKAKPKAKPVVDPTGIDDM